jgi:hypothetical protein
LLVSLKAHWSGLLRVELLLEMEAQSCRHQVVLVRLREMVEARQT